MKKLGIALLVVGIAMVSWYGYQWWDSKQSVTNLDGNVAKAINDEQQEEPKSMPDLPTADKAKDSQPDNQKQKVPDYKNSEKMAKLVVPSLGKAFDVFWGTDEDTLAKGVGEYNSKWTVPPGQGGHTVLSGHNNTVFEQLGDLDDGDLLYMSYKGEDYKYKIKKSWITDENDRSVIVKKNKPTLTLTTCYPFGYIKYTPKRYIVQAQLVQKGDLLKDDQVK